LIFNNYKTDHKYNTIQIPIEPDLMGVIESYLKHYPFIKKCKLKNTKLDVHFLVRIDSEPINYSGDITKISNKIYGRNIGSSMLRNIYLTSIYGKLMKELKDDTTNMGNSIDVAMNTYIKK